MRLRTTLALCALALGSSFAGTAAAKPPPIKHVFIIVLENKDYHETFGQASEAPYLAHTLPSMGQLLTRYYGIGHLSLDNYIAMVSGQSPNIETQSDCQIFSDFKLTNPSMPIFPGPSPPAAGQAWGQGCVYPRFIPTIADQLQTAGLTWKGYMEDMGDDPVRDNGTTCAHPPIGQQDHTQSAKANDQYASRHNPFIYFHSILDGPYCNQRVVPLNRLTNDLATTAATPHYSFITPDLCSDGHDEPCIDGRPGGYRSIDAFLRKWVPRILASPAFTKDGLLMVTFDESESGADSCCNEPTGPNTVNNGALDPGDGGGRIGAVLLSRYIRAGSVNRNPYNHYSMLRSYEDLFGLKHLGYARTPDPGAFGSDVYDNPAGTTTFGTSAPTAGAAGAGAAGGCGTKPLYNPVAGRLPYGAVLNTTHILRRGRYRPFLRLILDKPAATGILNFPPRRVHPGRMAPIRRLPLTRVAGCRAYHLLLPYVHGTVVLRASPGVGVEGRSFHY